jgi:hypothetical protein
VISSPSNILAALNFFRKCYVNATPYLRWMPRIPSDVNRCLKFVAQQPWGKPNDRKSDITHGILKILSGPQMNRVGVRRPSTGVKLRRFGAAQFVIIYAYLLPTPEFPHGVVSIRAIRRSRVKDVFSGVKEPVFAYGPARSVLQADSRCWNESWMAISFGALGRYAFAVSVEISE